MAKIIGRKKEEVKTKVGNSDYGIDDIRTLGAMEAIRKRPGMYVGSVGASGLSHIILEVISNSIDEHLSGYGTTIKITLHEDGSISIEDDARGMPIGIMKDGSQSLISLLTKLHTGGKFGDCGYNSSGGLNGVGAKAANALSKWLIATVKRDGAIYQAKFERGEVRGGVEEIGKATSTGTTLHFLPDDEIFTTNKIDFNSIKTQVQELSFLSKGLKFELENKITKEKIEYLSENGLLDYINALNKDKKLVNKNVFYCENEIEDATVEVAMQFNTGTSERVKLYTNNIPNSAGTHLTGFRSSFTKTINDYAKRENIFKDKDSNLTGEDLKEGLTLIINIKMPEPVFDGQTKEKLTDARGRTYVSRIVTEALKEFFINFKADTVNIINKASLAKKAREAAKKARETVRRKSPTGGTSVLPGKLTDCQNAGKDNSEVIIVEGDSAGGIVKTARDRKTQAVLPLKGKILNAEKNDLVKLLNNTEIKAMITAFGCGIGNEFDIKKLRYDRVIIMTDADVDGAHIRTLLLTFLFKYMRPLIKEGHVYAAVPPLYIVTYRNKKTYFYTKEEVDEFILTHKNATINYLKGLGEMDPDEIWDTTINPEARKLIQIKIENEEEASKLFTVLMGTKVAPRKQFIIENAKYAEIDN